jgi:hypothetical protein
MGCVVVVAPVGGVEVAVVVNGGVVVVVGVVFSTPPQAAESRINETTSEKVINNLVFIGPSLAWLNIQFYYYNTMPNRAGGHLVPLPTLSHLPNATGLSEWAKRH